MRSRADWGRRCVIETVIVSVKRAPGSDLKSRQISKNAIGETKREFTAIPQEMEKKRWLDDLKPATRQA